MKTNCCHSNQMLELENTTVCLNSFCENYLCKCLPVKSKYLWRRIASVSLFGFYCLFSFDDFSMSNNKQESVIPVKLVQMPEPLTMENLANELEKNEILCSKEVMAQISLESGNLKSFLLRKTNNMLGMRFPFGRETKAIGLYLPAKDTIIYGDKVELKKFKNTNQYAVYASWQDAIADYKIWQASNFRIRERYLSFLGNIYAQDTGYISKIKFLADRQQ